MRDGLLHTPHSLTEARLHFEIANRDGTTASELSPELGLDPGYLSRTVARLEGQGLVAKTSSEVDARQRHLSLTAEGREAFSLLDARSREEVSELLEDLPERDWRIVQGNGPRAGDNAHGSRRRGHRRSEPAEQGKRVSCYPAAAVGRPSALFRAKGLVSLCSRVTSA